VAAAAELADAGGYERLTLAAVAQRFGVKLPSLYKHVGGVEDLQRGVALLAVQELGAALSAAAVGRSGGDALHALGRAYRRYAREHPGRYAATVRAPDPQDPDHLAAAHAVTSTVFAVLAGLEVADDDLVHATRTVRSALHGFAALEAAGGFGLPHAVDDSFDHLLDAVERGLRRPADG
jgi:AcrR family transcriptional regulator